MSRATRAVPHHRTVNAEIVVPAHCLVVLVGASGSGKSTFAARWFAVSEVLSSDAFRARVGRGEDDQQATGRAFRALHTALAARLAEGRVAVVDATNIRSADRRTLLGRSVAAGAPAIAVLFDMTLRECLEGDRGRVGRHVAPGVVERQWAALRPVLDRPAALTDEGFAEVHRLVGHIARRSVVVRREAVE